MTMTKQLLLICVLGLAALTGKGLAGEINGDDEENTNDQLVLHLVAPPATDPAIDRALDNHYVWLDRAAPTNHKLLVFMPGTGLPPAAYQLVQQEAARLGYHVIGLMYPNSVRLASACPPTPDPDACFENARLEILDGIDRSPVVDVNEPNSIDNRLTKLLQYLTAQYPEEGWSRFLVDAKPKWSHIAVSGHSQGGGEAAMIAKLRVVARVVLFSSVPDKGQTAPAAPWVATHVTPAARYWGLAHDRDALFPPIQANWDSIGMAVFGAAEAPETSEPPYDFTHMLVTDLVPQGGSFSVAHGSTVGDAYTPRDDDGTPILRDAWRYLLTAKTPDEHDADEDETDAI
jgi:hypothetical protein